MPSTPHPAPIIGITANLDPAGANPPASVMLAYIDAVARAGGCPVLLPPESGSIGGYLRICDGVVFTGGDDPAMEVFGARTHHRATPMHPRRQAFELAILAALDREPDTPVLGICLGMQLMSLHAGGTLDQHLPDRLGAASAVHWDAEHEVRAVPVGPSATAARSLIPGGSAHSKHRQAVSDPGVLTILATAADGVIEAVADVRRPFYVGVQWHPERTSDDAMGAAIFRRLVDEARKTAVKK